MLQSSRCFRTTATGNLVIRTEIWGLYTVNVFYVFLPLVPIKDTDDYFFGLATKEVVIPLYTNTDVIALGVMRLVRKKLVRVERVTCSTFAT